ncbi:MAG: CZB domain-containing protein [Acidithiobacillus sp.]|nr:CZB domain-containing protein [Acidithiobacillus sp.]
MQHLRAIATHANYLKRVRECLTSEVACTCHKPHTECDFGKWWYAEVLPKKDRFSEEAQCLITEIEEQHKLFHEASEKVANLSVQEKHEEAKKFETELLRRSNTLIQAILRGC